MKNCILLFEKPRLLVYDDPDYAEVKKEMHQKLDATRKKYGDSNELDQKYIKEYEEFLQTDRGKSLMDLYKTDFQIDDE